MANLGNRIVVLIDMDCFFCQVEAKLQPEFAGKPLAVQQYTLGRSGGIIAVNYEARDFGVTRHMRPEDAKEKCPNIILATVPNRRGKPDTSRYRSAGREVIDVLKKHCSIVERASVDEAYLDITQIVDDELSKKGAKSFDVSKDLSATYIVGYSDVGVNDEEQRSEGLQEWLSEISDDVQIQRLALAGAFIEKVRKDIFDTTGFRCSAGISFNKILAKLACGLHKPNRQTILPASSVPELYGSLPVKKVRNLGGKLGDMVIDSLKCNVMADILPYSLQYLQNRFDDKIGLWLYNIARGADDEPVTPRLVAKSIGACKQFRGKQCIVDVEKLEHWLGELAEEVCERLEQDSEENERRASLLTVSFQFYQNNSAVSQSRSIALSAYKPEKLAKQCSNIVKKATQLQPISFLGLSAGKFIKARGSENFVNFFKKSDENNRTRQDMKLNVEADYETEEAVEDNDISFEETVINAEEKGFEEYQKCMDSEKNCTPSTSRATNDEKSSPCSTIQSSLKTDNFKQSFFMNILKEKRSISEDSELPLAKPNLSSNSQGIRKNTKAIVSLSESKGKSESKMHLKEDDKIESLDESSTNENEGAMVELKEIFPDLNDMDPHIIRMLPIHLQQEANKFLRNISKTRQNGKIRETKSKKRDTIPDTSLGNCDETHESLEKARTKLKDVNTKQSRGRPPKNKSLSSKSNIQNFFIKTAVNGDSDCNFKKCMQCDQLILISKFDEHNDFHVAQNLQTEMNRMSNGETRKRKVEESPSYPKKRVSGGVDDLR
ncbi:hypothetical protein QAD02_017566 [Eretmocerus hayati]|uniref:Uncharacterized protein n=1 Tax=Eretmocerus hayati TaxID=131215 RepID=A0ACC2PDW4_9HYME|nr:hypothetical protein QAD02_017566 [Eretmocerus hayati]